MMSHDQLFKDLFKTRFGDLVEIVLPKLARRFVVSGADFSEQEVFADMPQGTRNDVDILAKVPTDRVAPELVFVHVEIEGDAYETVPKLFFVKPLVGDFREQLCSEQLKWNVDD